MAQHNNLVGPSCDPVSKVSLEIQETKNSQLFQPLWTLGFWVNQHSNLNSLPIQDPFGEKRGKFDFGSILKRLAALKTSIDLKLAERGIDLDSDSDSETDDSWCTDAKEWSLKNLCVKVEWNEWWSLYVEWMITISTLYMRFMEICMHRVSVMIIIYICKWCKVSDQSPRRFIVSRSRSCNQRIQDIE